MRGFEMGRVKNLNNFLYGEGLSDVRDGTRRGIDA
jgi:hypothetical protein